MLASLARGLLKAGGWSIDGEPPSVDKAVLIAAPHTSNWDGVWGLLYRVATGLDVHFFAKRSLFWFPLGPLLRRLGGVPLDRDRAGDAVRRASDLFAEHSSMIFGLSPEGTRRRTDFWKTGFYRIALEAGVPVMLGYFDYANRRLGIKKIISLSGDRERDLEAIRAFYSEHGQARRPENVGRIRFRDGG